MKKLYFSVYRKNGYSLQCVIDLEEKIIETGYCLFAWCDSVHFNTEKELNKLIIQFLDNGFKRK